MKHTRLANICRDILTRWDEKKSVDEEQVYIFCDGIVDMINDLAAESEPDYKKVSAKLQEMWQYKDFEEMSAEEIFLCGGLWCGMQISGMSTKQRRQQKTIDELACVYESEQWFFKAIYKQPGIRHKDLAEQGDQSVSQLSQFVAKVYEEGLITYNHVGREKYYYLEKRGEMVYKAIQKKRESRYSTDFFGWYKFIPSNIDFHAENLKVLFDSTASYEVLVPHSYTLLPISFKPDVNHFQSAFKNQEVKYEEENLAV